MKLVRYGPAGEEKPGLLDPQGNIRSLASYIPDLTPSYIDQLNELLANLTIETLPQVAKNVRLGACIGTPGKVICVGYNSKLHAQQMGIAPISEQEMVVFTKPTSSVCGPYDPILHTRMTKKLDWEAELAVIIGKKGKYIPKEEAKDYIFGYACMNDLSDRYLQLEAGDSQYLKGKGFDNAAPLGPYLVTKDEIINSSDLEITLKVNGESRQHFNTCDYIHNDAEVVSYLSQFFTLYPGDVISMGSAPGTAKSWGEAMFLKPNDKVVLSITGLGQQEQTVVKE
jgi:2-keto-4-pentenoate hydratase/2-oxohepta-3-ene-1,7-dioic acid hydratase in catechol pathway